MQPVANTAAVVTKVGTAQFQAFGDQSVLRNKRVIGILATPNNTYAPDGTAGYPALGNVWLKLVNSQNVAFIDAINLGELQRATNAGQPLPIDTNMIDWTRSGLFFGDDATRTANLGKAVTLTVIYQ